MKTFIFWSYVVISFIYIVFFNKHANTFMQYANFVPLILIILYAKLGISSYTTKVIGDIKDRYNDFEKEKIPVSIFIFFKSFFSLPFGLLVDTVSVLVPFWSVYLFFDFFSTRLPFSDVIVNYILYGFILISVFVYLYWVYAIIRFDISEIGYKVYLRWVAVKQTLYASILSITSSLLSLLLLLLLLVLVFVNWLPVENDVFFKYYVEYLKIFPDKPNPEYYAPFYNQTTPDYIPLIFLCIISLIFFIYFTDYFEKVLKNSKPFFFNFNSRELGIRSYIYDEFQQNIDNLFDSVVGYSFTFKLKYAYLVNKAYLKNYSLTDTYPDSFSYSQLFLKYCNYDEFNEQHFAILASPFNKLQKDYQTFYANGEKDMTKYFLYHLGFDLEKLRTAINDKYNSIVHYHNVGLNDKRDGFIYQFRDSAYSYIIDIELLKSNIKHKRITNPEEIKLEMQALITKSIISEENNK